MINVVALQRPAADQESRQRGLAVADVEGLVRNLVLRCVEEDARRRPSAAELAMSLKLGQDYTPCMQEKARDGQGSGDPSLAEVELARERKDWRGLGCMLAEHRSEEADRHVIEAMLQMIQEKDDWSCATEDCQDELQQHYGEVWDQSNTTECTDVSGKKRRQQGQDG
eukprot:361578-Hanusia_phi.AAC.1